MRIAACLIVMTACERADPPPPCKCEQHDHAPVVADAAAVARDAAELTKQQLFEQIIYDGSALIRVDARRAGVVVPAKYATDPDLVLDIGADMTPPIPDLHVDAVGVTGSLTFDGKPFHCVIPWSAVFGIQHTHPEQFWPDDAPPEAAGKQVATHHAKP